MEKIPSCDLLYKFFIDFSVVGGKVDFFIMLIYQTTLLPLKINDFSREE